MIIGLLLSAYFILWQLFGHLWNIFFTIVDKIAIVYYVEHNCKKNITLNYYFNRFTGNYMNGTYYVKFYSMSGTNCICYQGSLEDVNTFRPKNIIDKNPTDRKKIILTNEGVVVNYDLHEIDKYYAIMNQFHNPITNMDSILKLMGVVCDKISLINIFPCKRESFSPNEVNITYLYS